MALQGDLKDMSVADLIQHICIDNQAACLHLQHQDQEAELFFNAGQLFHAEQGNVVGEEVIYNIIDWQDGQFRLTDLSSNEDIPVTIKQNWSALLLEAARRLDESLPEDDIASQIQSEFLQEEKTMAKKKSEILSEMLEELLQESSDINNAAIVGTDGLVYSSDITQRNLDENMVAASSAAILGLSKRSVEQLNRGNFQQTLIQGDDGNIIVCNITPETLFVGITPPNVNLGMAFAETRSVVKKLRDVLE